MDKPARKPYRKHNSFVELRHKHAEAGQAARARIAAVKSRAGLTDRLSAAHRKIFEQAMADIFSEQPAASAPRFALSPNVVEEINTYPDEALPRYLVHRYRYEIFPQQFVVDDFPPYLQIEPSSICNYRCVFCYETDKTFTRKSAGFMGHMKLGVFKRVVDEAEGRVEFLSLASRGEPLLCPDIAPMLAYTRGKFLNLKMNTNASLLDEVKCHAILQSGIKTLVFSADAAEEPLYSQLRVGGRLDKVLANIERFQTIRATQYRDSSIITRVSGVKVSQAQNLDSMQKLWGNLVDQVAFVEYNPWENTYQQPINDIVTPCSDLWRRMFVWWDGKVNPCDTDYKSTLCVGSINERGLGQLWNGTAYEGLRRAHLEKRRHEQSPCNRCTVT
ncbi:MAG: SPASM domain-containing protein [Betaproteobacteria bacterium]|nr:SPASM domain-containing protein [Betaproteobacteria bacterium]MBI3053863.1 SPASM domain-containing protein [Betaproteobacteria bacterium]